MRTITNKTAHAPPPIAARLRLGPMFQRFVVQGYCRCRVVGTIAMITPSRRGHDYPAEKILTIEGVRVPGARVGIGDSEVGGSGGARAATSAASGAVSVVHRSLRWRPLDAISSCPIVLEGVFDELPHRESRGEGERFVEHRARAVVLVVVRGRRRSPRRRRCCARQRRRRGLRRCPST